MSEQKKLYGMDAQRWILLNILWHSLPPEASDKWITKQMEKAGATPEEIKVLRMEAEHG